MILSLSHNFIFVHVPKAAGSALTLALRPYATIPQRSLWTSAKRRLPIVERPGAAHFRIHDSAARIRRKLSPEVYGRFYSFAAVRDPFDHAVSHYEYMKQYRSPRIAARFARMSFEAYLAQRLERRGPFDRLFVRLPDQSHFLVDEQGRLAVDRLLRFEQLSADFRALTDDLGLGEAQLRTVNRTRSRSSSDARAYRDYYDATTEDMVRALYARDFDLLGYSDRLSGGAQMS